MKKLTDIVVKGAKPGKSIKKLSDGNGLVLLVHPSGSKYWSYRYRYLGKEKSLSLGVYPEVTLGEARQKLMDARKIVADGSDPSEARKSVKRHAMAYNVLDVSEFKHYRINHSKLFADKKNHINGIENFWNQAKRHMRKFNGIPRQNFGLFLKECEWRFNNPNPQTQLKQLRQWVDERLT